MISANNITMQFGEKPLFENISIKFSNNNRYGLIGANGSGKSTFMKILAKELKPTDGSINIDNNKRLGILKQDQYAFDSYQLIDTVIMGYTKLWKIKEEKDKIYASTTMTEADGLRVAELEMQFAELDGYSAQSSATELLLGLDIAESEHYKLMQEIAPGLKLRVLLAQALFSDPDILLLDEPTNNLDINSIRWLEGVLNQKKSTMVIISHDRHFLNSVCTHMADLDYGDINIFPGNYDNFMIAATAILEKIQNDNAKKEGKIKELKHFVSRFSANASKSKQATSRLKQLEKIELTAIKPSSRVSPYIIFQQNKKLYRNALVVKNINKKFTNLPVLNNINFMVEAGDKIAIIGKNGIGKTTLMQILTNNLAADSGEIKFSENANIGYYAQDNSMYFDKKITVLEWMTMFKDKKDDMQVVRSVLGKMLFGKEDVKKIVTSLSGGEKGRMMFGKLMLKRPNILIMDEPTNHLDMESIEALNLALNNYQGTLIFVSHDREFVSSLANKIIEIKANNINYYNGAYDEYLLANN